jgi:hypothetical protein
MTTQNNLMRYCPMTGRPQPYPSHAAQWRSYHGATAWLFNPWSGDRRDARDVGSDVFGLAILQPGENMAAAQQCQGMSITAGGASLGLMQAVPYA